VYLPAHQAFFFGSLSLCEDSAYEFSNMATWQIRPPNPIHPASHTGAPRRHSNSDHYAHLRAQAIWTLEATGFDSCTMVERGVVWAEDQDPFGHVMQSRYMQFLGMCFHRVMESYDEYLSETEYEDMLGDKSVVPMVSKYELEIKRQVTYPDAVRTPGDSSSIGMIHIG
jgi:hypothetical protein